MLHVNEEFIDKLTESISILLNGKKVSPISIPSEHPHDAIRQLAEYLNRLIIEYDSFTEFMYSISRGERGFDDPGRLLSALNRLVKTNLSRREESLLYDDGLDMAICRVDRHAGVLDFAGAGLSLFLTGNGKGREIKGDDHSIGYRSSDPEFCFTSHRVDFQSPSCFYMLTDGIIEQPGGDKGIPFGKKRFVEFISRNHSKPMAEQKEILWESFNRYRGSESQRDDITIVGLKV
jgi:serine phosphatase RsbU (regulator of sigma subunit)